MDRERLDAGCERLIIALVLALLLFAPLALGAVGPVSFLVVQSLAAAAGLVWGVRLWLKPRPQFLTPPACWGVLAFLAYAVALYFLADVEYLARLELARVTVYALVFFLVVNNLQRQETVNLIGYALVFLAMAVSLYAAYQFFTGRNAVWQFPGLYAGRGSGTYINPNHFAGFLGLLLPLGLAYTLVGRMKPVLRILLGYATCVMAVGLAVSLSRGAWVASALGLFLFFGILLLHRGYRLTAGVVLLVMISAAVVVLPRADVLRKRAARGVEEMRGTEYSRYLLWRPSLELWRERPWLGNGPGHFDVRFRQVRPQEIQLRPDRVHNDFLNTLVDWGVVGLTLVLGTLGVLTWGVARAWSRLGGVAADLGHRRSNRFAFVLGASVGLAVLFCHSFVDFNLHIPANALIAVTWMALLAAHLRFATERWWFNAPRPVTVAASLALLAAVGFLALHGGRAAAEQVWLRRAAQLPDFSPARAGAYQAAFAAEPQNAQTAYEIGECYRTQSWEGGENYPVLARTAMAWFVRAQRLNPYDGYAFLRHGMCLDWLNRRDESWPSYSRAEALDPNGYYTVAHVGWHFVQQGNFAAARPWFERSLALQWKHNPIAANYLDLCNRRLLEAAASDAPAALRLPP